MNDEIREILDRLDFEEWEVDLYKVPITWCELYDIRDYITNLQQDLEKANDIIAKDRQFYKNGMDEYVELKKENEKENQFIKDCGFQNQQQLALMYLDYKSRVEKADEYIDKQKKKMYKSRNKIALFILMKLENILQNGSENNEQNK
jgi:hypothetical protein